MLLALLLVVGPAGVVGQQPAAAASSSSADEQQPISSASCPCIGLAPSIGRLNCNGNAATCVLFPGYEYTNASQGVLYSAGYGASCQKHMEPGHSDCSDASGAELPAALRAEWCDRPWCYVDPGQCDKDIEDTRVWPADASTRCELAHEATCPMAFSYSTCGSSDAYTDKTYVTATRSFLQLHMAQYMLAPITRIGTVLPLFELEVVDVGQQPDLQSFTYSQILAMGVGTAKALTPVTMAYIGMENGLFMGYTSPASFILRAPSGSPDDLSWHPYTLATANDACAATGITPCHVKGTGMTVSSSCPASADTNCVDANVEGHYSTDHSGAPVNITGWRIYDPRERPWYQQSKAGWNASGSKIGFSTVYEFLSTGSLGITATGNIIQNGSLVGVYGLDYDLAAISTLLQETLAGRANAWTFAVERTGTNAGLLVGSTTDALYDAVNMSRVHATSAERDTVRDSALFLQNGGENGAEGAWPEGFYQRLDPEDNLTSAAASEFIKYEVVTSVYTGLDEEVDWLLVAGFDINCGPSEIWKDGYCENCEAGSQPNVRGTRCIPCREGHAGLTGLCNKCAAGTKPDVVASICELCRPGYTSMAGNHSCVECPSGRTGTLGLCQVCRPGYFALDAALGDSEPCESCLELEVPDSLLGLDIDPPNLEDGSFCPGGPPGLAAFCPYRGLWVDYDDLTLEVRLQSCETSHACNGTVPAKHNGSCREWIVATNASAGAVCGEGRQGLLCGTCMEDYTKVDTHCVKCPHVNIGMLLTSALWFLGLGFVVVYMSVRELVSTTMAENIWDKFDTKNEKQLGIKEVGLILNLTGVYYTPEQLESMWIDDGAWGYHARDLEDKIHRDEFINVHNRMAPSAMFPIAVFFFRERPVNPHTYCHFWCSVLNVSFVLSFTCLSETFGLFTRGAANTIVTRILGGWVGDIFNLDPETAMGECVLPMSYMGRFMANTILTPVAYIVCILLMLPCWKQLRSMNCLQWLWEQDIRVPTADRIDDTHRNRAFLTAFFFLFMPLSRNAIQALICRDNGKDGEVLAFDMAVRCWEGDHVVVVVVAVCVLLGVCVIMPTFLVSKVNPWTINEHLQRMTSNGQEAMLLFDEYDNNGRGEIETCVCQVEATYEGMTVKPGSALEQLANRLAGMVRGATPDIRVATDEDMVAVVLQQQRTDRLSRKKLGEMLRALGYDEMKVKEATAKLLPTDGNECLGHVTRDQFQSWYKANLHEMLNLRRTPFDILYINVDYEREHESSAESCRESCRKTRSCRMSPVWWFMHDMVLKIAVNVAYLMQFGEGKGGYKWQIWVNVVIAFSMCTHEYVRPYPSRVDKRAFVLSMLSLATVTHVSSMFKRGEEWSTQYLIVTAGLFLIPTFGITHSYYDDFKTKKRAALEASSSRESSERRPDVIERGLTANVREKVFSLRGLDVVKSAVHWRRWTANQVEGRNAEAAVPAEVDADEAGGEADADSLMETPPIPQNAAVPATSPPIRDLHNLGAGAVLTSTNMKKLTAKAQTDAMVSEIFATPHAPAANARTGEAAAESVPQFAPAPVTPPAPEPEPELEHEPPEQERKPKP